jgi:hydrogenase nickel incorporation protein HypB
MCATCGCDANGNITMHEPGHQHEHGTHSHQHTHSNKKIVDVEKDVLHENDLLAERNRGYFEAKNILSMNLVSSPGSGKTSITRTYPYRFTIEFGFLCY